MTELSTEEIKSHAHLLTMRYQKAGGLNIDGHVPSGEERMLQKEIRSYLPIMLDRIENGTAKDIYELNGLYDMSSRISGLKTSSDFASRQFVRAVSLWLKGDKSITEEELMLILRPVLMKDMGAVDDKYSSWYFDLEERWLNELEYSCGFGSASFCQCMQRFSLLLREDLWVYYPDNADNVKQRWVKNNVNADVADMPLDSLYAYRGFLFAAQRFLPSETYRDLDVASLRAIVSHPGILPESRAAFQIDLDTMANA